MVGSIQNVTDGLIFLQKKKKNNWTEGKPPVDHVKLS